MAEGGMAEGGIKLMFMGEEAAFSFTPLGHLDFPRGIGSLGAGINPGGRFNPVSANMEDEQARSRREMLALA